MSDLNPTAADSEELDAAALRRMLEAQDEASIEALAEWLAKNAKGWVKPVLEVVDGDCVFSAEASCEILRALSQRTPADQDSALLLVKACLAPITTEVSSSLDRAGTRGKKRVSSVHGEADDTLVRAAVGIVTANRRSKLSTGTIACLADAGTGGALILSRAFDGVRSGSKVQIIRGLEASDVLQLGDNVVASLASSVTRLLDEVELTGRERDDVSRFLTALGSVEPLESAEIDPTDELAPGHRVFHATWGAGTVVSSDDESVTLDFGNAGQRTLLRAYATLRRAQ